MLLSTTGLGQNGDPNLTPQLRVPELFVWLLYHSAEKTMMISEENVYETDCSISYQDYLV